MIIPIRCFTCGKVLADKWEFFQSELRSEKGNTEPTVLETTSKDIQKTKEGEILDKMGLTPEDLLCVGDAPNDLSMFEIAHWSVAVGGAFAYVAKSADVESPFPHGKTIAPLVNSILNEQE